MKRFTKVCLWIFGICLILGILLGSISWAMGFHVWPAFRNFGGRVEEVYEKMEGEIRSLSLHVQAGSIQVEEGEDFAITGKMEGKPFHSRIENGVWEISAEEEEHRDFSSVGGFYVDNEGVYWKAGLGEIHITVPKGISLEEIMINVEAGAVELDHISCDRAEIHVQAGNAEFRGAVKEQIIMDCQAGAIYSLLTGKQKDFAVNVECSMGSVRVGNQNWAGLFNDTTTEFGTEHEAKKMDISCEVGNIDVDFENE